MEMRLTRDLSAEPPDHLALGTPENIDRGLASNPDLAALHGSPACGVFTTIARFHAIRPSYVRSIVGGSSARGPPNVGVLRGYETSRAVRGTPLYGPVGDAPSRGATLSGVSPSVIRRRHRRYLEPLYREHELASTTA